MRELHWLDNWLYYGDPEKPNMRRIGHYQSHYNSVEADAYLCGDKIGTFPMFTKARQAIEDAAREWLGPASSPKSEGTEPAPPSHPVTSSPNQPKA